MGLRDIFRRRRKASSPTDRDLDGLVAKLDEMRGDNPTPMGAGIGSIGSSSPDRVQHLANAARDARYVDRSVEDDRLAETTEYRTID